MSNFIEDIRDIVKTGGGSWFTEYYSCHGNYHFCVACNQLPEYRL